MRYKAWKDYELIDTSSGERLERWKDKILIRPDPQIIWKCTKTDARWKNANATYYRSRTGGGSWKIHELARPIWTIGYNNIKFKVKLMNFKHTGIFPEQAVNWDLMSSIIKESSQTLNILNLFAYTGGASLACASAGAKVCHVDSSRGMVAHARENAELSGLSKAPIRWIVDDCEKFVLKEIRRGNKYDGIVMDPPSYGRGPNGEIWKIEEKLFDFLELCESLLCENARFLIVNSYSTGLSPSVMGYLLSKIIIPKRGGKVSCDEIGLPVSNSGLVLPTGNTAIWTSKDAKISL